MNNPIKILTMEEYEKYKENDRFIHEITFAHGVEGFIQSLINEFTNRKITFAHGVEGWEEHNLGMCYYVTGTDYKVSAELQSKAKKEYQKRKNKIIKNIGNKLVFVGMGMDFEPSTINHIGNHRIRTYFENNDGIMCFIEFGTTMDKDFLRCDHGLMNTKKDNSEWKSIGEREQTEQRVSVVENIRGDYIEFTKENVLKLVNENFNCSFKEVEVAEYFVSTSDYTCKSKRVMKNECVYSK